MLVHHSQITCLTAVVTMLFMVSSTMANCPPHLDHEMRKLHSSDSANLCDVIAGKPALVINTASHCGFTPQFEGLEALHKKYAQSGLVVIGFASDDFYQAADTEEEAATVCYVNYGVSFMMFAPSHVKGDAANPVFKAIAAQSQAPSWNFNKYLLDSSGTVVAHFGSNTAPNSEGIAQAIEGLLSSR